MILKKGEGGADADRIISKFKELSKYDKIALVSYLISELKRLHDASEQEILGNAITGVLVPLKGKDTGIPVGVFGNDALGSLEAVVKFLKEEERLKFSKIAKLLNRSSKTIWATYHNSVKKMPSSFGSISREILIPASVFSDRSFSTLECIVGFIKDLGYSNHEVALMLRLDDRTIWTVYDRVKRKRGVKA